MKRIIVTGSTSGIGWGIAQVFAKEGHKILLNGIESADEVAGMVATITKLSGHEPVYSNADLSTHEGCGEIVEACNQAFGGVDVVINNAGVQHKDVVEKFPREKWSFVLRLNLEAPFYIAQHVLPAMYKQGWGRLIHISSAHGLVASTQKAAYVTAKHGLMGLSKVIALEAAGKGVTSNCICPGWSLTPLVEKQIQGIAEKEGVTFDQAKDKLLSEKQPSKEFVSPEQLGKAALFLASDDAAQVTGAHLSMDGGWTAV